MKITWKDIYRETEQTRHALMIAIGQAIGLPFDNTYRNIDNVHVELMTEYNHGMYSWHRPTGISLSINTADYKSIYRRVKRRKEADGTYTIDTDEVLKKFNELKEMAIVEQKNRNNQETARRDKLKLESEFQAKIDAMIGGTNHKVSVRCKSTDPIPLWEVDFGRMKNEQVLAIVEMLIRDSKKEA